MRRRVIAVRAFAFSSRSPVNRHRAIYSPFPRSHIVSLFSFVARRSRILLLLLLSLFSLLSLWFSTIRNRSVDDTSPFRLSGVSGRCTSADRRPYESSPTSVTTGCPPAGCSYSSFKVNLRKCGHCAPNRTDHRDFLPGPRREKPRPGSNTSGYLIFDNYVKLIIVMFNFFNHPSVSNLSSQASLKKSKTFFSLITCLH